ncbi:MAG TPA: hypothetical protein VKT77_19210, partial [Chthonomonadaceae bacterium]|nr:hypothetical protein [Chthonomonadaceae bacterium]
MPTAFDLQITVNALRDAAANRKRFRRAGVKGRGREAGSGPIDVVLCVVDHFEPQAGSAPPEAADRRLEAWTTRYPAVADRHRDSDGRRPPHSFFYPWDEYRREEMARLQELCSLGYGEIELHLHHEDDTEATLRAKIDAALVEYRGRGALSQWPDGRTAFGFIHGNWAL